MVAVPGGHVDGHGRRARDDVVGERDPGHGAKEVVPCRQIGEPGGEDHEVLGTPPLEVPRAAFEVWLPLPTFLAAIPMAILGSSFAAAQVSSVVLGSIVPALAWWLARDVAFERGLPDGRRRVVALGAGLTAAVYLPLVLHSALPDSTTPFAVLGLLALILMAHLLGRPATTALDARLVGLGVLLGLAAWTRNEVIWLAGTWVLLDYGDLIVHVFTDESRQFYQLERLWRDAERVELPEEINKQ